MEEKPLQKKIVIIGAGFAGVKAALKLAKLVPQHQITLINDTHYDIYQPDLYEIATVKLQKEEKQEFRTLIRTSSIPLHLIFKKSKVQLMIARVTKINLVERRVEMSAHTIGYDYLIIAMGSTTAFYGIPGAMEYSHPLKNTLDALNIRNDLRELARSNDRLINVVIAGGGFTGVELAGMASVFLKDEATITIVEAMDTVMPGMSSWVQEHTRKRLEKLGVKIMTKTPIKEVKVDTIISDSTQIPFDYLVWTTGVKGESLNKNIEGTTLGKKEQVSVLSNLSVFGHPEVFSIGDVAEYIDPATSRPVPPTAWAAEAQAEIAAHNVAAMIHNQPMIDYHPVNPGFVIPIGPHYALSTIFGYNLSGVLAWWLKRIITLKYLFEILPPLWAVKIWMRGYKIYT